MTKILLTGANGLLGQKMVALCQNDPNITLLATGRGPSRMHENVSYRSMDICSEKEIQQIFEEFKPDVLIHGAAMTNVDHCEEQKETCWSQNVKATEFLAAACKIHHCFMCLVSTDFIFDGTAGPYKEEDQANPISFYGWSKLAAEHAVIHAGISYAIARTILVFGIVNDMSRTNIILWVKNSLEKQQTIKVVTDQFRTPTLAEDLADGCLRIAKTKSEGIFNIGGRDLLTPYEMAIATADFFHLDKSLIQKADSTTFTQVAKRPPRTGLDISKAQRVLGYEPHTFKEGIALLASQLV